MLYVFGIKFLGMPFMVVEFPSQKSKVDFIPIYIHVPFLFFFF